MRFLTLTENKRLNGLIGFLCVTLAILMALALISYSPRDASFNVSGNGPDAGVVNNWIGPVGSYGADLLFQVFGFAAFLLPAGWTVPDSGTPPSITNFSMSRLRLPRDPGGCVARRRVR